MRGAWHVLCYDRCHTILQLFRFMPPDNLPFQKLSFDQRTQAFNKASGADFCSEEYPYEITCTTSVCGLISTRPISKAPASFPRTLAIVTFRSKDPSPPPDSDFQFFEKKRGLPVGTSHPSTISTSGFPIHPLP